MMQDENLENSAALNERQALVNENDERHLGLQRMKDIPTPIIIDVIVLQSIPSEMLSFLMNS